MQMTALQLQGSSGEYSGHCDFGCVKKIQVFDGLLFIQPGAEATDQAQRLPTSCKEEIQGAFSNHSCSRLPDLREIIPPQNMGELWGWFHLGLEKLGLLPCLDHPTH